MGGPRPLPLPPGPYRIVTMLPKAHTRSVDCAKDTCLGNQALCRLHFSSIAYELGSAFIQAYSSFQGHAAWDKQFAWSFHAT